jgi:hypothetical protein
MAVAAVIAFLAILGVLALTSNLQGSNKQEATVNLKGYGADCDEPETKPEERCWLPTQFDPQIRPGETVTLRNAWPMHGDTVEVACEVAQGEAYNDGQGKSHRRWFGLLAPKDKADPAPVPGTSPNLGRMPTSIDGKFLVFVQASWVLASGNGTRDNCADIV